ncbi:VPLPA-CTERM sorting domain-containing protein [Meridianimarinicoccus aquatilis]|uniref:VPLPA-CTERM sorting domain-containing protein n=1 Tax=Meridianimarinicoccus aquatilis TaxID=2552766 RepID=A0A4R6B1E4_9RHOB|nr:VPLPA-CTERM sorting domain-containing protein [Fluviibacterium aquatile]QIE42102.1 VPLPA-CTERM sorting domain-containing protein [Rhodobacteraceae bacterium SC52]TDL90981.1 VPLPA-CTERM sorting domain-containing protein [Fluviibacterium aquatile]
MIKFNSLLTVAATALALVAGPSIASSFNGAYWDSNAFSTVDQAIAYTENNAATATFLSTAIDYPNAGGSITDNTTLQTFLGADGSTLSGAFTNKLDKSVFSFSGTLDLIGTQSLKIGSDDGFALKLDGVEVLRHSAPRAFSYTIGSYEFTGATTFELIYYENYGNTGVEFQINDTVVTSAMAAAQPAAVPVPAALPMLLAGLGAFGLIRRRA